jgi:hypothetical protein
MITDFRLNKNSNIQVKVGKKWYNLITFTDDCPYGKYGYKMSGVKKPFNPYVFFKNEDIEKIETYLRR